MAARLIRYRFIRVFRVLCKPVTEHELLTRFVRVHDINVLRLYGLLGYSDVFGYQRLICLFE